MGLTGTRLRTLLAALFVAALALAGCGGGGDEGEGGQGGGKSITVWTLEDNAERVKIQQDIVAKFQQAKGINVKLVPVNEDQFATLMTNASAAGDVPDAIGALSLGLVNKLAADDVSDPDAAAEVIDRLGRDTFSERALKLVEVDGKPVSVPSDGWTQLLVYRKDLFDKAGLAKPDTYEAIKAAADKLNAGSVDGIVAATKAGDTFTQQTFEHFALANGCQLTDDSGNVTLTSPQCVAAFDFFGNLIKDDSTKGAQDVDSTRATYFAGRAAMVVWSSFILDEMAGLRNDALPTCDECKQSPDFLAKNSGIVTGFKGPNGTEPAQYGEISGWAITKDGKGDKDATKTFVEYMMNDAYVDWLGMAPEGKFPVRTGTQDDKQKFTTAWDGLKAGVDTKKALSEVYPADVLDVLRGSVDTFSRWGFPQGQGQLAGAMLGELPVPAALNALLDGQTDAAGAAKQSQDAVEDLKSSLGGG
jgi:multiple sugar transport system substrate-binding protein